RQPVEAVGERLGLVLVVLLLVRALDRRGLLVGLALGRVGLALLRSARGGEEGRGDREDRQDEGPRDGHGGARASVASGDGVGRAGSRIGSARKGLYHGSPP